MPDFLAWVRAWLATHWFKPKVPPSVRQRASDLIKAVDAGGLPLNPARVNDIARQLGLDVSSKARVEDTIARIRAALNYREL